METDSKHGVMNNYSYSAEYNMHVRNIQDDKPMDLTYGNSIHKKEPVKQNPLRDTGTMSIPPTHQFYHSNKKQFKEVLVSTDLHNLDNEGEVMRAAKSLFSKRTRTLYHWMYPNTPKFQLKSAISLAWDTMGSQEKQFYVSQVLGKFGYLQNRLMINPQLECLTPIPYVSLEPDVSNMETRTAVSNLLEDGTQNWPQISLNAQNRNRKRGRPRGSKASDSQRSSKSRKLFKHSKMNDEDDFTDDPELRKELEQFQWALHLVDN